MTPNCAALEIEQVYDCIADDRLRLLFDYWQRARGNRLMPARRDIDPLEVLPLLSKLWVCDYEEETEGFRFRIVGAEIREAHGGTVKGHLMTDLVEESQRAYLNAILRRVIDEPLILFTSGYLYHCQQRHVRGHRLVLPIGEGQSRGLFGITAMDFTPAAYDPSLAEAPIIRELPLP